MSSSPESTEPSLRLNAFCVPGIQNTPEDWEELQCATQDILSIMHRPVMISPKVKDSQEWMEQIIRQESEAIRANLCSVLIAHSYGCFRAITHMQQNPAIRFACLLNPPQNSMNSSRIQSIIRMHSESRNSKDTFVKSLMHDVTMDMDDATYHSFIKRHEEQLSPKEFGRQFAFLKNGRTFQNKLDDYEADTPFVVFQSAFDPWFIEKLLVRNPGTVVDLPAETGHYPHVTQPAFIAAHIRESLEILGLLPDR